MNFSWSFAGNSIYAFSQLILISVIAKLGSVEMVGQYALALAITSPVFMFMNLQLRSIQATDSKGDFAFSDYFGLRIHSVIISLIVCSIIAFFSGMDFKMQLVIFLVGINKGVEALSDIFWGDFQKNERMDLVAYSKILKGFLSIIISFSIMKVIPDVNLLLLGVSLAWLITLILMDLKNSRYLLVITTDVKSGYGFLRPQLSIRRLKKLFLMAVPLGVVASLDTLNTNIPRYFIQINGGIKDLGYFAGIVSFMVIGGTIVNALAQSVMPRLAAYFNTNLKKFIDLFIKLLLMANLLGVLGVIVAVIFGRQILTLVYTADYATYENVLIIIMVAAWLWYLSGFTNSALTAARFFTAQVPTFLMMVVGTIISSMFLIPRHGLMGAAIAVCIGMFIRLTASGLMLLKVLRVQRK